MLCICEQPSYQCLIILQIIFSIKVYKWNKPSSKIAFINKEEIDKFQVRRLKTNKHFILT